MSANLRSRIEAELDRREPVARTANEGSNRAPWRTGAQKRCECCNSVLSAPGFEVIATDDRLTEHIALHDPADALRRYQHARKVLARHEPYDADGDPHGCRYCGEPTDCFDLTDLAESLGLEDR
jgi:hypothetical protein